MTDYPQTNDKLIERIWRIMQRCKGYDHRIARETLVIAACGRWNNSYDRKVRDAIAELPKGQRLLLERFVNNFIMASKESIAFVGKHYISDCTQDINVTEAIVEEVYYKKQWVPSKNKWTVKQLCDWFLGGDSENGTR